MTDSHPMHSWDDQTSAEVRAYCEAGAEDAQAILEQARAALADHEAALEAQLEHGRAVNRAYKAASGEMERWAGKLRTLDNRTVDSSDYGGHWQANEGTLDEQIARWRGQDTAIARELGGSM